MSLLRYLNPLTWISAIYWGYRGISFSVGVAQCDACDPGERFEYPCWEDLCEDHRTEGEAIFGQESAKEYLNARCGKETE